MIDAISSQIIPECVEIVATKNNFNNVFKAQIEGSPPATYNGAEIYLATPSNNNEQDVYYILVKKNKAKLATGKDELYIRLYGNYNRPYKIKHNAKN